MTAARSRGYAETAPDASDPRLRGRTYSVPFEDVWQAALRLTGGRLRGWSHEHADDADGHIESSVRTMFGTVHDIVVSITLDENAQTRVDASARAAKPLTDFGRAARRLNRFFSALDRELRRAAAQRPARSRK